jgi:hypothetical protein
MSTALEAAKRLVDTLGGEDLHALQEFIAQKTLGAPTDIARISHVTIVGEVEKPRSATSAVKYIPDRTARIAKARDYRRTICKAVATYCLYTGHGFIGCCMGEDMNLRERSDGESGRVTDGRKQHYTIAARGGPDSMLESTFTFIDGLIEHTLLYQSSRAQNGLQVCENFAVPNPVC